MDGFQILNVNFNWSDLLVLGVFAVFGIIGLTSGLINSVFKVASFFLSIYLSYMLYPWVSAFMLKTPVYDSIKKSIFSNLLKQKDKLLAGTGASQSGVAADTVLDKLPLPDFLKNSLSSGIPDPNKLFDFSGTADVISAGMAKAITGIIGLIALFILIRLALLFVGLLLKGFSKVPVVKQLNNIGGLVFGLVEGLLAIYILCTILTLFNSSPAFSKTFEAVNQSTIAKYFYENNVIVDIMFPGK